MKRSPYITEYKTTKEAELGSIYGESTYRRSRFSLGQINLQADERATMIQVKSVISILISEGWSAINFVVMKKGAALIDDFRKSLRLSMRELISPGFMCAVGISVSAFTLATQAKEKSVRTAPAKLPLREVIVSYGDESSKMQLYRVNQDGSGRRKITAGSHDFAMPDWSRDGKKIAYVEQSESASSLWISDPDGKNPKMIVKSGINMKPSWLPDSKHLVWFDIVPAESKGKKGQLKIINTETLQSRHLFADSEQVKFSNLMPVISPDGTKVAFVSNRSGHFKIWVSNLDGSNAKPISKSVELDEKLKLPIEQKVPAWSPDGKWIAHWEGVEMDHLSRFTGKPDAERDALIEGSWNVWIVSSDGKSKRKAGHGDDPNWSPDGYVTRSFPDPTKGGANVMIEKKDGWKELAIVPIGTTRYGRFTWKP